jgi:membrane protein
MTIPTGERRRSAPAPNAYNNGDRHGRGAHAPTEIPPTGWRDVLMRVFHGITEDRITTIAGG